MEEYYFIAYDVQDDRAQQCASWIAERLGNVAVLPQRCWALGDFAPYLEYVVSRAERLIVVLTLGFLSTAEPFVRHLRTLVLQEGAAPAQERHSVSRLLLVLAGECKELLHDAWMFSRDQEWVDLRPLLNAEEACQQVLLDALCPSVAHAQAAGML